eukprot:40887-Lingulodinium_polyedra.AAC.1
MQHGWRAGVARVVRVPLLRNGVRRACAIDCGPRLIWSVCEKTPARVVYWSGLAMARELDR